MSTDAIDIDNVQEEDAMDCILFVIKDELPKDVVDKIYQPLNKLKGVRNILDMAAFVLIEFNTKVDADAARAKGFEYVVNNKTCIANFSNHGVIAAYMKNVIKPGIGVGFERT